MLSRSIQETIEEAVRRQQAGELVGAEALYRQVLNESPDHVIALQLLGTLMLERGNADTAITLIQQAIELAPRVAAFHNNLGNAFRLKDRLEDAIESYRGAVEIDPQFFMAHMNLGNIYQQAKKFEESLAAYSRAIQIDPSHAAAHQSQGDVSSELQRYDDATIAYQQAIALNPTCAETHNNLANVLTDAQRFDEAIDAFNRAIALKPDYAEALTNLGTVLKQLNQLEEAIDCHQRAITFQPDLPQAHCNLGAALADSGQLEEALQSLDRAIELAPNYAEAHVNRAVVLCNSGRVEESRHATRRAMELATDRPDARCNLAQIYLTLGDFKTGWREYESRWKANPRIRPIPFTKPRWNGEPLHGKTILLHAEQGLGDTIQFVRYVPLVAALASQVILECQAELVEIFKGIRGVQQIIPTGSPLPDFDYHCPLMTLPLVMETTLNSVPAEVPYIHDIPHRELPHKGPGLNVGLVWAGRSTHSNDRNRSMSLMDFASIALVPNITIHTLQKGPPAAEALSPPLGLVLVDHSPTIHTFLDTAAIINQLDLVISVDTSVAHLAGALGKPVWVLLPLVSDWRWMRDRSDSPWYPTMRLFRQQQWGNWTKPAAELLDALQNIGSN